MALEIQKSKLHHIYLLALASSGDYSGCVGGCGTEHRHGAGSVSHNVTLENDWASSERRFFDVLHVVFLGVGGRDAVARAELDTEMFIFLGGAAVTA